MTYPTRSQKWQHGRYRCDKIKAGTDTATNADLEAWREIAEPKKPAKTKRDLLYRKLKNAAGGVVTYRMLTNGARGALQMSITQLRRARPELEIQAVEGLGYRMRSRA